MDMILPEDFINSTKSLLGNEWDNFVTALQQDSPTSIRLNPKKAKHTPHSTDSVPWCAAGYYLEKRPSFTFDPLFHAGAYYVQEASSMFVGQVFEQYVGDKTVKVLDLCAAPGGKSTHIASLISDDSLLVANEVIRSRANILSENITKSGYPNTIVTNSDPSDIGKLVNTFDVILIDAPCSGEGMFRKDNEAIGEWSTANVQLCKERQQRIVADVWNALKPEGILIYSTCTYNKSENEENVLWIKETLGADILPIETQPEWNIQSSFGENIDVYHFLPHKTKGEGFFLAALRKQSSDENSSSHVQKKNKKQNNKTKSPILDKTYQNYICQPEEYTFFEKAGLWFAFPTLQYSAFEHIVSQLKLVSAGIYLGEVKGKDFIPQQSLALSNALNSEAFNTLSVDKDTAIAYLRKEALTFTDVPTGYLLLMYEGSAIGFVKNIGNRANNLYPSEWRIRSAYNPSQNK